jgi:hypothetical protein
VRGVKLMKIVVLLMLMLFGALLIKRRYCWRISENTESMECLSVSEIPKIEEFDDFEDIKIHISTSVDFTTWVEPMKPCPKQRDLVISKNGYFPFMNAPYRGDPIEQFGCASTLCQGTLCQGMLEHETK